jgi:hypothetical protein
MMFFTDRAEALRYATNAQMQLWLLRSQPKPITVTVVAAQAAPDADPEEFSLEMEDGEPEEQHRSGDDCSCATCNPDPDDADEAEVARLEREFDEKHAAAWGYKSVEDMYEAMHREMEAEDAKRRERSTESLVERFYTMDDVGCVSRHPHLCRCGDCITYLAGE